MDRQTPWGALERLVAFLAWGLAVGPEPERLEPDEAEALYRAVNVGPWLQEPSDYLGEAVAARHAGGWNPNAFYPTPHDLCELMVGMTMGEGDHRAKTVHDPCVGSGRMLLHASNHSYRLSGQDIDPMMVAITKINGALYAPWLSFPAPDSIFAAEPEREAVQVSAPAGQLALFAEGMR
jgi:hypothetical protein